MITTEFRVFRQNWVKYSARCAYRSGYVEDWGQRNLLVKVWKWHGFQIWSWVVEIEDVPQHVVISRATLGYAGGWESKFAKYLT